MSNGNIIMTKKYHNVSTIAVSDSGSGVTKLLLSTAGLTNNNLVLILVLHPDIEF
jgi:hypothetical protein